LYPRSLTRAQRTGQRESGKKLPGGRPGRVYRNCSPADVASAPRSARQAPSALPSHTPRLHQQRPPGFGFAPGHRPGRSPRKILERPRLRGLRKNSWVRACRRVASSVIAVPPRRRTNVGVASPGSCSRSSRCRLSASPGKRHHFHVADSDAGSQFPLPARPSSGQPAQTARPPAKAPVRQPKAVPIIRTAPRQNERPNRPSRMPRGCGAELRNSTPPLQRRAIEGGSGRRGQRLQASLQGAFAIPSRRGK